MNTILVYSNLVQECATDGVLEFEQPTAFKTKYFRGISLMNEDLFHFQSGCSSALVILNSKNSSLKESAVTVYPLKRKQTKVLPIIHVRDFLTVAQ